MRARSDLATAARDTAAVGFGLFPLGLAFGLLLVQSGLQWWWAPIFSMAIYAGSLEFLAIGMLIAVTPLVSVAAASLMVNFRHVFYSLSFPLHQVRGRAARVYSMYALTDEAYAVVSTKESEALSSARILWIQVLCQVYWVGGSICGALRGPGGGRLPCPSRRSDTGVGAAQRPRSTASGPRSNARGGDGAVHGGAPNALLAAPAGPGGACLAPATC